MIDDSHEFSYTVTMCTPVSSYLQQVELPENGIVLYDRCNDLIQGLSEVFTAFLCNGSMLNPSLLFLKNTG